MIRNNNEGVARARLDPAMAEHFTDGADLAARLMAELDAEIMSVPPPPKDTETKKAKKPHVRSRKLKGDVEKAQAAEKAASEKVASEKAASKVSEKASSGVSSGSKRKVGSYPEQALGDFEEPLQKRSRIEKFGINLPITALSSAQKMARVRAAVKDIYTDADDKAMLDLGLGEINALYESWLETSIRMTSVINRRSQFEHGVNDLKGQVEGLNKTVTDHEAEILRLNTELNSQKETFEEASKAVNEYKALLESKKKLVADLETVTLARNTAQKDLAEAKVKLAKSKKKVRHLDRKLKEASSQAQVEHGKFLESWKRSPEGLDFIGQMASRSYAMAVRETKERLKGVLTGPDSTLDWSGVEAAYNARIAEEQRLKAEAVAKKDPPSSSASKAPLSSASKASEAPTVEPENP
ncbi:hypothetical protein BVRB_2g041530 [Beta vulgaris subsp. vulgaris]|nr:hypothetical protein BVRB_2g041530 [Beta vulgaris subsp. vulgaris]